MRILTVLFAYACAAITAAILIVLIGMLGSSQNFVPSLADVSFVGFLVLITASYALPVALPVIVATEVRKSGDWRIFIGAGALLGVLLTIFFTEIPFEWSNLRDSAILLPIATIPAFIYWVVAWKWLPPTIRAPSESGGIRE